MDDILIYFEILIEYLFHNLFSIYGYCLNE